MGLFSRKKKSESVYLNLDKSRQSLGAKIKSLFASKKLDDKFYEQLEEDMIMADVSVDTTMELLKKFKDKLKDKNNTKGEMELFESLIEELVPENSFDITEDQLNILFVFGVNGVGKTTSIAKLANLLKSQGASIIVAAADTYRAAAVDQLDIWCERAGVHLVKHTGKSKPSAVVFDAVDAALNRKANVLIVDTAGRLHNRENLMEELKKLNKILADKAPNARRFNLLVVDSTTGQNAVMQAKTFHETVQINGVLLSKMDSTAKGGIAITLAHSLDIPVVFIGTGEKIENIEYFDRHRFIKSIFE